MLKVFAVYDEKAEAYGNLICCPTRGLALRAFADACGQANSPMAQSPEDYKLYELGFYEPNTGGLKGVDQPIAVCTAMAMVKQLELARLSKTPVEVVS